MLAMQTNKILLEILFHLFLEISDPFSIVILEFCPATWVEDGYQETCCFMLHAKGGAQSHTSRPSFFANGKAAQLLLLLFSF